MHFEYCAWNANLNLSETRFSSNNPPLIAITYYFFLQKLCSECKAYFCGTCVSRAAPSGQQHQHVGQTSSFNSRTCKRCKILLSDPPIRADLMELRVKVSIWFTVYPLYLFLQGHRIQIDTFLTIIFSWLDADNFWDSKKGKFGPDQLFFISSASLFLHDLFVLFINQTKKLTGFM